MDDNLFNKIDIEKANTQVPDGMAENPLEVGSAYEKMIQEAGGIDLQVLGVWAQTDTLDLTNRLQVLDQSRE